MRHNLDRAALAACPFEGRLLHRTMIAAAAELIIDCLPAAAELVTRVDKHQRYVIIDGIYGDHGTLWAADSPGCELPDYKTATGEPWVACVLRAERLLRTALQRRSPEFWGWRPSCRADTYRVNLLPAGPPGAMPTPLGETSRPEVVVYCPPGKPPRVALVLDGQRRLARVYVVDASAGATQGDGLRRAAAAVADASPAAAELIIDAFTDGARRRGAAAQPPGR